MNASLYDDVDEVVTQPTPRVTDKPAPNVGLRVTGNWNDFQKGQSLNPNLRLMQSQLAARKAKGKVRAEERSAGQATPLAPVMDLGGGGGGGGLRFNQRTGRMERVSRPTAAICDDVSLPLGVPDEYDPMHPNDYQDMAKLKRERRRMEEKNPAVGGMSQRSSSEYSDDSDADEEDDSRKSDALPRTAARGRVQPTAAIAPPPSLLTEAAVPPKSEPSLAAMPPPSSLTGTGEPSSSKFGINNVAAKMMARMGYKEGQGLGREGQGMSTALVVEKTGLRAGKIIHERDRPKPGQVELLQATPLVADEDDESGPPPLPMPTEALSNVILLQNMCAPGEVDDGLEPETAEECAKYGRVMSCMIYELPDVPEDEAVRIFVEFAEPEAALRAIQDLHGRFFDGRIVRAGFYDSAKFTNLELAESSFL